MEHHREDGSGLSHASVTRSRAGTGFIREAHAEETKGMHPHYKEVLYMEYSPHTEDFSLVYTSLFCMCFHELSSFQHTTFDCRCGFSRSVHLYSSNIPPHQERVDVQTQIQLV